MAELNNTDILLREINELVSQYQLLLEQQQRNNIELQEFDEEFAMFFELVQRRLRTEGDLVQRHFLNEFETQFGFPIDFFPPFFYGVFGSRTRTTTSPDRPTRVERIRFFELKFNRLVDDNNRTSSFRSTFRVDQGTFEWLVNRLQDHSELQFDGNNVTPVYIQVAVCLIRLANNHIGYRMAYMDWFISNGSYINFTRRVVKAIKGLLAESTIQWPTTYDRASDHTRRKILRFFKKKKKKKKI
jgi:hypothetical protein